MNLKELSGKLRQLRERGFVKSARRASSGGRNDGAVGNTLESLLGIQENNLQLPDVGEFELKAQRKDTSSLITLLHREPSPSKCVAEVLLPLFGWPHVSAGVKYPVSEKSFRQTIHVTGTTDRGFGVVVSEDRIEVYFDNGLVSPRHSNWLESVRQRRGNLGDLNPRPHWLLENFSEMLNRKLRSTILVEAATRIGPDSSEEFHFERAFLMRAPNLDRWLSLAKSGGVYIDFDARTGHNHGTKFRIRQNKLGSLYSEVVQLI